MQPESSSSPSKLGFLSLLSQMEFRRSAIYLSIYNTALKSNAILIIFAMRLLKTNYIRHVVY